MLDAGKHADFIVLDQILFEIEPKLISETKAILTVVDGQIVYE